MIRRWLDRWGPDEVLELVNFNNSPPPLSLRPLGLPLTEAMAILSETGREARPAGPGIPCLILDDGTDPAQILEQVPGIIQDPGAALVTVYAQASPGRSGVIFAPRQEEKLSLLLRRGPMFWPLTAP
jgi:hypothetical protein